MHTSHVDSNQISQLNFKLVRAIFIYKLYHRFGKKKKKNNYRAPSVDRTHKIYSGIKTHKQLAQDEEHLLFTKQRLVLAQGQLFVTPI